MSEHVYEVCDPENDPDEWTPVPDAMSGQHAVRRFLSMKGYNEADFDSMRPFKMLVRNRADGVPLTFAVRVVPAHFEVSR